MEAHAFIYHNISTYVSFISKKKITTTTTMYEKIAKQNLFILGLCVLERTYNECIVGIRERGL